MNTTKQTTRIGVCSINLQFQDKKTWQCASFSEARMALDEVANDSSFHGGDLDTVALIDARVLYVVTFKDGHAEVGKVIVPWKGRGCVAAEIRNSWRFSAGLMTSAELKARNWSAQQYDEMLKRIKVDQAAYRRRLEQYEL